MVISETPSEKFTMKNEKSPKFTANFTKLPTIFIILQWIAIFLLYTILITIAFYKPWDKKMQQSEDKFAFNLNQFIGELESLKQSFQSQLNGVNSSNQQLSSDFEKTMLHLITNVNEIRQQIVQKQVHDSIIPVGFVYIQFPWQAKPHDLWTWADWDEITVKYAGHFFRAEGGSSAPFGVSQRDAFQGHRHSFFHESKIHISGSTFWATGKKLFIPGHDLVSIGSPIADDWNGQPRTANETRPINYAIKIWKRVQRSPKLG